MERNYSSMSTKDKIKMYEGMDKAKKMIQRWADVDIQIVNNLQKELAEDIQWSKQLEIEFPE